MVSRKTRYPKVMTIDEFDDHGWEIEIQLADDKLDDYTIVVQGTEDRADAAQVIAEAIGGVVYYQVDLESGDRGYSREEDTWIGIFEVVK